MNYGKKVEKIIVTDQWGFASVIPVTLMTGEVCRVEYQDKNGDISTMVCRTGVHKYATGTGKPATNLAEGRIGVWSYDRGGYRTLRLKGILFIKHGGIVYDFRNFHAKEAFNDGYIDDARELMLQPGEYHGDWSGRTPSAQPGFVLLRK